MEGRRAATALHLDNKRSTYTAKVTETMAWSDIPTCREAGIDVEYQMLRGIFMTGGVTPEQVAYYVGLLDKVRHTPDWQQFMEQGAFNPTVMTGPQFRQWLESAEAAPRLDEGSGLPGELMQAVKAAEPL